MSSICRIKSSECRTFRFRIPFPVYTIYIHPIMPLQNNTVLLLVVTVIVLVLLVVVWRMYRALRQSPPDTQRHTQVDSDADADADADAEYAGYTEGDTWFPDGAGVGVSTSLESQSTVVPLPTSGRFYDSGEFHPMGSLSLSTGGRGSGTGSVFGSGSLSSSLSLYGKAQSIGTGAWNYATLVDGTRRPVYAWDGSAARDCMVGRGCRELRDGDLVWIPNVDRTAKWRVRLFSK
jgi:hypothetical protein